MVYDYFPFVTCIKYDMNIILLGSGNVAAVLGRKFFKAGHHILQVAGRNSKDASALAYEWKTDSTNYSGPIKKSADVYIIAVSDQAIMEVTEGLRFPGKVVAHTAASVSKDVLKNVSEHYGVFYPLQSLRKDAKTIPDIPFFIDGNDTVTVSSLENLAHSISKQPVHITGDKDLAKLHLAAVFANNFTNHLLALTQDYCEKEGIVFDELRPLMQETIKRLELTDPKKMQTGPALRHDDTVIAKHLAMLEKYPQLKEIYTVLTKSIQQLK